MKRMKRIGIFAGTFDPIHKGHIAFSLAAAQQYNLDKVYLLPEREPRAKYNVTNLTTRMKQLNEAIRPLPLLETIEFTDKNFTVATTLPKLQQQFKDARIFLLLGSDIACKSLSHWDELATLLPSVDFIIGVRGNCSADEVEAAMRQITKQYGEFHYAIIPSPHAHTSSSQLRAKIQN